MQNYITKDDLLDLGVKLDNDALEKLVDELNDKVDEEVGNEIIDSLTPEDVATLAEMQDKASEKEIGEWIAEHVPDYAEIIEDNAAIVIGEFAETSNLVAK
jgi:hypothetical protein